MARDEVYELEIRCDAYNENVALKSVDIHPSTTVVAFEDGHEITFYSREEAIRLFQRADSNRKAVRPKKRFRR